MSSVIPRMARFWAPCFLVLDELGRLCGREQQNRMAIECVNMPMLSMFKTKRRNKTLKCLNIQLPVSFLRVTSSSIASNQMRHYSVAHQQRDVSIPSCCPCPCHVQNFRQALIVSFILESMPSFYWQGQQAQWNIMHANNLLNSINLYATRPE